MAITAGLCVSAKLDFATGVHQPGDRYMLALYSPAANLSPFTTEYSKQDEVVGKGYTAGGQALQGYDARIDGINGTVTWTKDTLWRNATIKARGGLVYNASKGNRAVIVIDVMDDAGGPVISTNGNFKVDAGVGFWIG